jgi:hypothetical protein
MFCAVWVLSYGFILDVLYNEYMQTKYVFVGDICTIKLNVEYPISFITNCDINKMLSM